MARIFTEEHRKKLSLAKMGKPQPWRLGKSWGSHSEESKIKIANYQKGKTRSVETKNKMSLSKIGHRGYFLGGHLSDEAKKKISVAQIGNKNNLGHNLSDEAKRKISVSAIGNLRGLGIIKSEKTRRKLSLSKAIRIQKVKGNIGPYKGTMFRSKWELIVAQNLDKAGIIWEYEPKYFILENGQTYTPDFKVDFGWIEVKGFFLSKAINKLNMFVNEGHNLFLVDGRNINNPDLYDAIPWRIQ